MKVPEYALGSLGEMSFCTASMSAKDNVVWMADESFYGFVGKTSGINVVNLIHPDYRQEFKEGCDSLQAGQVARYIVPVKDALDEYHILDIIVRNDGKTISDAPALSLTMYCLNSIESGYISVVDNLNKYRSLMAMYQDYILDYDTEYDAASIYIFYGAKATPVFVGSLQKLKETVTAKFTTDEQRDLFETLYQSLVTAKKDGSFEAYLPINDNSEDSMGLYHIETKISYKSNKKPVVNGIIRMTNVEEKEVPYYATKEAKDPATGLLNKRACKEYTENAILKQGMLKHYMMVIDIDNFKSINDTYGHLFGDEVINTIASTLNTDLEGRGVAGRFGGDEFYIFTSRMDTETDVRNFLTAVRKKLLYAFEDKYKDFCVTLSVGVSLYPNDGMTMEELFKKADKCLYLAKNRGKNRFIIYDEAKHGEIKREDSVVRYDINPLEKAEYLGLAVADISANILSSDAKDNIDNIFNSIRDAIGIDGIRIYREDETACAYVSGEYKQVPDISRFLQNKAFLPYYNGNHILMLGNLAFFEAKNKEFAQATEVDNIMGMLSFYFNDSNGKTLYFFYDVFNHGIRWNESDKNYLLLLSRLLASIL